MTNDFSKVMKMTQEWNGFCARHPKVPDFMNGIRNTPACEGQEIAVAVRYPDGTEYKCGIRVRAEDLAMLETLKTLR